MYNSNSKAVSIAHTNKAHQYLKELYESTMFKRSKNKRYEKMDNRLMVKMAHNTYLGSDPQTDSIFIRLWNTDILIFRPDNSVEYNSGGWKTKLTKERMNDFAPFGVWSEKGRWYIHHGETKFAFADGIRIYPDGTAEGEDTTDVKAFNLLKKRIKRYVGDYATAVINGRVSAPGAGDCFYCSMVDNKTGKPIQETSHLMSHIPEKYYVPSLFVNAVKEYPIAPMSSSFFHRIWVEKVPVSETHNFEKDIAVRDMKSTLRKYLYKQFSIPA